MSKDALKQISLSDYFCFNDLVDILLFSCQIVSLQSLTEDNF